MVTHSWHAAGRYCLRLLLQPHVIQRSQTRIIGLVTRKVVERLSEQLLHAWVPGASQQLLDRFRKLIVEVGGESWSGMVGEDANEHDGIVLSVCILVVVLS